MAPVQGGIVRRAARAARAARLVARVVPPATADRGLRVRIATVGTAPIAATARIAAIVRRAHRSR